MYYSKGSTALFITCRLVFTPYRLKATGVVNVENPVVKAMHEGRFEELD